MGEVGEEGRRAEGDNNDRMPVEREDERECVMRLEAEDNNVPWGKLWGVCDAISILPPPMPFVLVNAVLTAWTVCACSSVVDALGRGVTTRFPTS